MDDTALMLAVVAGDLDKLSLLYERYKMPLYAYFYKLTGGNGHSSEDLVHTVFYRVLKYKDQYRGTGTFAGWLFVIAHNAGIDFRRNTRKTRIQTAELDDNAYAGDENSAIERIDESAILLKALARLKPDEREILILSKQECLKYNEIARICNCSENVVKIRVFRALKKLRQIYFILEGS